MAHDIGYAGLAACYLLLLLPLAAMLWLKIPLVGPTLVAVARMTAIMPMASLVRSSGAASAMMAVRSEYM